MPLSDAWESRLSAIKLRDSLPVWRATDDAWELLPTLASCESTAVPCELQQPKPRPPTAAFPPSWCSPIRLLGDRRQLDTRRVWADPCLSRIANARLNIPPLPIPRLPAPPTAPSSPVDISPQYSTGRRPAAAIMSLHIALDNPPEFFTNLDFVTGRIILGLSRPENVGSIVVKLEGEAQTALAMPDMDGHRPSAYHAGSGNVVTENHKLLYMMQQVYPDANTPSSSMGGMPGVLYPGSNEFPFRFKMPLNNICWNPQAMAALNGIAGVGGSANVGLFGLGGFRTMDGTKQLMLRHVKSTLPPSFTGFPREAEIRYYLKVTVQRPGLFKENWRYQIGLKFLPVEPPRPPRTSQEAFARRPFNFKPRAPTLHKKKSSFFGSNPFQSSTNEPPPDPPSLEVSARLPFPTLITCNQPIPLRLISRKLQPTSEQVYMVALEIVLVGYTNVRVQGLQNTEVTRWVICTANNLSIALGLPDDPVDKEFVVPDALWSERSLPNTVSPSFTACNISRRYEIELKIGLSWGLPSKKGPEPQMLYLPLKLSKVDVLSGITPPAQLVNATAARPRPPPLPPRQSTSAAPTQPPSDPLYPPQLGPNNVPLDDDAPPSYDEAMAQDITVPQERPAYSGVTAENDPSSMPPPEKSGLH